MSDQQTSDTSTRRRDFLKGIGTAAVIGATGVGTAQTLSEMDRLQVADDPIGNYPYREWEDLYRDEWDWDSISRSTHSINCTGSCSWNVYVKNGQVWREEQAADYPRINQDVPDSNPRGCNKGACYQDYVHGAQRVKYPLKRTGERGEGKWERIDWDTAVDEIAEKVLEEVTEGNYDAISGFTPIPAMSPVSFASGSRLINLLGGVSHSFYDWYADLPPGEPITWGHQTDNAESADWFHSDYIIAWGSNIDVTRIPDAKYYLEARYDGAKTVGIFTDYSQTAIHSDEWLAPDAGSDAALALGMARTIVDEGLYDEAHLKEQTDMPLLVREDTGKFLRAAEVPGLPDDEKIMVMRDSAGDLRIAPASLGDRDGQYDASKSIELDFDPQLSVDQTVNTTDGAVAVRSVWERLQDELAEYTPQEVYDLTGVGVETHQRIAREFARADRAKIIHGKGINDWYHNDLGNRALQLLVTLTGHIGRRGTGFDHYVGQEKIWTFNGWKNLSFPTGSVRGMPTTLWTYYHAGIMEEKPEVAERIEESVSKDWMPLYPAEREDGTRPDPSVFFVWRGNYFNQAKGGVALRETLWPKLDLVVDVNYRMDTTALYSDYVLPSSSNYEKVDLSMTDMHSYVHPFTKAIEPLGESKSDWEIFRLIAERIQEKAQERGIAPVEDRSFDRSIDLQSVHDDYVRDWIDDEADALHTARDAVDFVLENSTETNPDDGGEITFEDTVEQPQRFEAAGDHWTSPLEEDKTYTPWMDFVQDKEPWPTFTGRQQYYVDHDWFLELGEQLPTYKPPINEQDPEEYPLRFNTPHGRYSIHSTWRDDKYMLRLNRGGPVLYIHPDDAERRGIEDGDSVRISNEADTISAMAKIYPSGQEGTVKMAHGWEDYQFEEGGNFNTVTTMTLKPTQLIQYPEETGEHLHFFPNYWGPTGVNSDIRVEVEQGGGDGE
jgi:nitrate reductase alpha subunit